MSQQHTLALLETTEGHLGAGNVLLGVLEVFELSSVSDKRLIVATVSYQGILLPCDSLLLVGIGI